MGCLLRRRRQVAQEVWRRGRGAPRVPTDGSASRQAGSPGWHRLDRRDRPVRCGGAARQAVLGSLRRRGGRLQGARVPRLEGGDALRAARGACRDGGLQREGGAGDCDAQHELAAQGDDRMACALRRPEGRRGAADGPRVRQWQAERTLLLAVRGALLRARSHSVPDHLERCGLECARLHRDCQRRRRDATERSRARLWRPARAGLGASRRAAPVRRRSGRDADGGDRRLPVARAAGPRPQGVRPAMPPRALRLRCRARPVPGCVCRRARQFHIQDADAALGGDDGRRWPRGLLQACRQAPRVGRGLDVPRRAQPLDVEQVWWRTAWAGAPERTAGPSAAGGAVDSEGHIDRWILPGACAVRHAPVQAGGLGRIAAPAR
mmetsp:Transcript_64520/g.192772  ORF Transcript_64520/g.192772 Transcript_64520/m.192772 type:complete len:379 (-) Transcript_64520:1335-2471(-)